MFGRAMSMLQSEVRLIPPLQHLLSLPFQLAVVVEWVGRMSLVGFLFVETIDGHRGEEDNALALVLLHRSKGKFNAHYICVVIKCG